MIIITKKQIYITSFIIVLILICVFSIVIYSNATAKANITLNSSKQIIENGEEVEISVNINGNKTGAFTSYLYFDNTKFDYISGPENTNLVDNHIIYVWYDQTGGTEPKTNELGVFKFKAKQEGIATFTVQGEYYSQVGQLLQTEFADVNVQIGKEETALEKQAREEKGTNTQADNSLLQSLRLGIEGISPNFAEDVFEYYITVENTINEIEVSAIPQNPNAVVSVIGNTNLKDGVNTINVQVTSQDGTQTKNYVIEVTKTGNIESANTNLETLAIENVELDSPFFSDQTNYKAEVSNTTENLKILAIPESEGATVDITGGNNLQEGNNIVTINVTAENGFTKKKYAVMVYKRNAEEETLYKQQQEENKQALEHAYEIAELNTQDENTVDNTVASDEENKQNEAENKNTNIIWYIVLGMVVVLMVVIIIKYVKIKGNRNL